MTSGRSATFPYLVMEELPVARNGTKRETGLRDVINCPGERSGGST